MLIMKDVRDRTGKYRNEEIYPLAAINDEAAEATKIVITDGNDWWLTATIAAAEHDGETTIIWMDSGRWRVELTLTEKDGIIHMTCPDLREREKWIYMIQIGAIELTFKKS